MGFLSGETGALKAERRMLRGESESIEHLLDTYSAKTAFDADALVSPSGAVKEVATMMIHLLLCCNHTPQEV